VKIVSGDLGTDVAREVDHVYRYVDQAGTVHFVDAEKLVPEKFKKSMQKIDLKSIEHKTSDGIDAAKEGIEAAKEGIDAAKEKLEAAKRLKDKGASEAAKVQKEVGSYVPFVRRLDLTSVGVGVGGALLLVFALKVVLGTARLAIKAALLVALVVIVLGFYFGYISEAAGLNDKKKKLVSPTELVDDAKRAVDQANRRTKKEEQMLKKIEGSER
jgi:hypothetical protein